MTEARRDHISLAVAHNITVFRRTRRWTLRQVSDRCAQAGKRVAISRLSRIENAADGSATLEISIDNVVALAAAFNVTIEELLTPWEPKCTACLDTPPPGFSCTACGTAA